MLHEYNGRWSQLILTIAAIGILPATLSAAALEASAPPPPTTPAKPEAAATESVDPVVTLLDAGAEPRQALRLNAVKGDTAAGEMIMKMTMSMSMGGMNIPPQPTPQMRMVMQTRVTEVRDNGDAVLEFEYPEVSMIDTPGVSPDMVAALSETLDSLKGARGSMVVTNRYFQHEPVVTLPDDASPELRAQADQLSQSMKQMTLPVPEEAVGLGARWRVEAQLGLGGIKTRQTCEVTLAKMERDSFSLDINISQVAAAQDVVSPQMPPNVKARLNSLVSSGTGTSTLERSRVLPVAGASSVNSDTDMTVSGTGMPEQQMTMRMQAEITFKAVPVPPAAAPPSPTSAP